jgi:DNA-binding response OmpR family regulator
MSQRTVRVLHIEDDRFLHRLLAHFLAEIGECRFEIVTAESERRGLELFDERGADLIVLDYRLAQGDGLHCLKELRRRDPHVPVIAISGMASSEIAQELIECGADDYLDKRDLSGRVLAQSIRGVLARWDAWRKRAARRDGPVLVRAQSGDRSGAGDTRIGGRRAGLVAVPTASRDLDHDPIPERRAE